MKIKLFACLFVSALIGTGTSFAYESSPFVQSPDVTQAPAGLTCQAARGNGSLVCRGDGDCSDQNGTCFSCTSGMKYQPGLGCYSCVQGTSLVNKDGRWVCSG